jgi:hypothetical protein
MSEACLECGPQLVRGAGGGEADGAWAFLAGEVVSAVDSSLIGQQRGDKSS